MNRIRAWWRGVQDGWEQPHELNLSRTIDDLIADDWRALDQDWEAINEDWAWLFGLTQEPQQGRKDLSAAAQRWSRSRGRLR